MRFIAAGICALVLSGCAVTSIHQFTQPAAAWQTRTGQLAYKGTRMSLIGEVLVRFSNTGDLELTFSKGPGVNLFTLRQDAKFASAEGPLTRGRWAGPTSMAPERLRGWFALREKILAGGNSIESTTGGESFNLRF